MQKIGFIGLGRMGSGISRNMIKAGYPVAVFDIDAGNLKAFADEGFAAPSKRQLMEESDVIFLSLPGSPQVEETVVECIRYGASGKTIVDLSTSYPLSSQKLYEQVGNAGGRFADASLTGTPVHAQEGSLIITFGGDRETFDACSPILACFASRGVHYMGGAGAGNIAKLANNYLAIMYVALYAEIFPLAEKMGFDTRQLFEVIGLSGVACPMYQRNASKIVDRTYDLSFSLDLALKDLGYTKKLFEELHVPSYVLDGGLALLRFGQLKGYGGNDLSEMSRIVREFAGLE